MDPHPVAAGYINMSSAAMVESLQYVTCHQGQTSLKQLEEEEEEEDRILISAGKHTKRCTFSQSYVWIYAQEQVGQRS